MLTFIKMLQGVLIPVLKYQISSSVRYKLQSTVIVIYKMLTGQINHLYRLSMVSSFVELFSKLVSAFHRTCKGSDFLHKRCQMFGRKKLQ